MESFEDEHELTDIRERRADRLIQAYIPEVLERLIEKYGESAKRGMHRTALIQIARVREAQEQARLARLENAYFGNRAPGITDEELQAYTQEREGE